MDTQVMAGPAAAASLAAHQYSDGTWEEVDPVEEAVAWLKAELEEAYDRIAELETELEVSKNEWSFKDHTIAPKHHSNYRGRSGK